MEDDDDDDQEMEEEEEERGGELLELRPRMAYFRYGHILLYPILYFSVFVCLSVRYRFSRQPLNHLPSNLAGVFDMVPERQLSILVSNECIFNDLLQD